MHGWIRWPADTDKMGQESLVPIGPEVREAIDRVVADRPGIGRAYLFPTPGDQTRPMSRHLADRWLRRAEKLAGLESQGGSLWHAFRRGWVTSRKHLPTTDVASAGGWKETSTLMRCYSRPDPKPLLRVALEPVALR